MAKRTKPVQTEKNTNRKFTRLKVATEDGTTHYTKVYLQTTDDKIAHRRITAIDGLTDPAEARRRINVLAKAASESDERKALARMIRQPDLVPAVTMDDARRELEGVVCDFGDYEPGEIGEETVAEWRNASSPNEQRDILLALGVPGDYLSDNPDIFAQVRPRSMKVNPDAKNTTMALASMFGVDVAKAEQRSRGPRLSDCIEHFEIEQRQDGRTKKHTDGYVNGFRRFIDDVGDKPVRRLSKADFVGYFDHIRLLKAGKSAKTINDQFLHVRKVLNVARRRMPDGVFSDSLDGWLGVLKMKPYKTPLSNAQPMPVHVFRALLAEANKQATINVRDYAASLPVSSNNPQIVKMLRMNNTKQSIRIKRSGAMLHSMLCLSANVGATGIDFVRLTWTDLVLDHDLPLFMRCRDKTATLLGIALPRRTPLLPTTVKSLKRWRKRRQAEIDKGTVAAHEWAHFVYTNDAKRPFDLKGEDSSPVSKAYSRLRRKAQAAKTWNLRHLRNVGATLAKANGLDRDMRTTFLGHSDDGTNRFYEGDVPDTYLSPLVNLIGESYFEGEQVGTK